jgi:hypothetical protein
VSGQHHIAPPGAFHASGDAADTAERILKRPRPVPVQRHDQTPVLVLDLHRPPDDTAALRAENARLERALADHARDLAALREQNAELRAARAQAVAMADEYAGDHLRLQDWIMTHHPEEEEEDGRLVDAVLRVLERYRTETPQAAIMPHIVFVSGEEGDWEGVYIDGALVAEGHSVDAAAVGKALGANDRATDREPGVAGGSRPTAWAAGRVAGGGGGCVSWSAIAPHSCADDDARFDALVVKRALRRIVNRLAQVIALVRRPADEHDWQRASGAVECEVCGDVYFNHATDPLVPWLHMLCDGRRVKL